VDIKGKVRQFIISNFYVADPASLADGTSLLESGTVDSTGILEVIAFIEDEFQIKVEDQEMVPENLDSVNNLEKYVAKKRAA
jgi:acyl carrier protein